MLIRSWLTIVALVASLSPAPALGALLPVSATLDVVMRNEQALCCSIQPERIFRIATATGFGNSVGGSIATVPAGLFAGNPAVSLPMSPTFILGITRWTVPASSLDNPSASFGPNGVMGLSGAMFFYASVGGSVAGSIPLAPIGGSGMGTATFLGGLLPATLLGETWKGGTRIFTAMVAGLAIAWSVQTTAYDNRTFGGAGTLQLVAPVTARLPNALNIPTFGVLTLTYTPEPGTLTLLGVGVASLAMIGRRKQEERG